MKNNKKSKVFVKIRKNDVLYSTNHPMRNLLITFLFFKRDVNNDITTSINTMCEELGLSTRNGQGSPKELITEELKYFIDQQIIIFKPRTSCMSVDDIAMKNVFVVEFNFEQYLHNDSNYLSVSNEDFNNFRNFVLCEGWETRTDKIFNLFLYIKQHMINRKNGFKMSYVSKSNLIKSQKSQTQTLDEMLEFLEGAGLIYITNLSTPYQYQHYSIYTVYTLEPHTEEEIIENFNLNP